MYAAIRDDCVDPAAQVCSVHVNPDEPYVHHTYDVPGSVLVCQSPVYQAVLDSCVLP